MALAPAFERDSLTHEEGIALLFQHFGEGKIPFSVISESQSAASLLPSQSPDSSNEFPSQLALMDTDEKLRANLLELEEPTLEELDSFEDFIKGLGSKVREIMTQQIAKLPSNEGGRPRAFSRVQEAAICKEVAELRGPGVHLKDIFIRVALRNNASKELIKQTWQKCVKKAKLLGNRVDDPLK